MIDYNKLTKAIKLIWIANIIFLLSMNYSFSTTNFGIITIDLFHDLIGYFLIIVALKIFMTYDKTAKLVVPFGYAMMIISLIDISMSTVTINNLASFYVIIFVGLISLPINIYLIYQLFTIMANLCGDIDNKVMQSIKKYRNFQIILTVITQIITITYYCYSFINTNSSNSISALVLTSAFILTGFIALVYLFGVTYKAHVLFKNYKPEQILQVED